MKSDIQISAQVETALRESSLQLYSSIQYSITYTQGRNK